MPPRQKNTAQSTARAAVAVPTVTPIPPVPVAAPISPTPVAAPISPTPITAPIAVPITPTATPGPTTAAANVNILCNPQRHYEGESFHLENIFGDEGDEMLNSPAPAVRPAADHSPLQTVMNTTTTDRLATGGRAKVPQSSTNIHFFFR
ncbi:hypothetical protein EDB19DRAFT_1836741 [Suillus lakei]|nr:hypothetical protein EDB19DRAFT_1836741 [Suillus lakei]